jgi:hypothetical protein
MLAINQTARSGRVNFVEMTKKFNARIIEKLSGVADANDVFCYYKFKNPFQIFRTNSGNI